MNTSTPLAQDEHASPPPDVSFTASVNVPPFIEQLAKNPPPRKIFVIPQPTEAECERALDTQPGAMRDSLRLVWIAAKLYGDQDDVIDRLVFHYLYVGYEWPVPVRAAILASCSWALHLEQRLAAIESRRAGERKGAPPPILTGP